MAYVKVPKDLSKVKTKVALNLTKRQLIGFSIAVLLGFPVYLLCKNFLSTDISMILMSIVVLPILFATLYEKDNLPFEKHLAYIVRFHKAQKIRVYKSKSIYNTDKEKDEIKGITPISKMALSTNRRRRIE
ncbi:PrgI family protein [Lachnoanaerobaculum sp. ICM7]|uniref:PrgI family protein n=1 Tax=Lachnoanaerobaculum sp. ICM7 TaxID=936594 RepID=UPI00027A51F1|nr:PrgI family protein [Lachnoanaerobaculum sp. ICM7]EJP22502.1 PrgI family protein [Lachnoanaerobaculum sp. ICM7]